jgi:hypothetical protein
MRELEGRKEIGRRRGRKEGGIKKEEAGKRSVIFCVSAIQNVMAT